MVHRARTGWCLRVGPSEVAEEVGAVHFPSKGLFCQGARIRKGALFICVGGAPVCLDRLGQARR